MRGGGRKEAWLSGAPAGDVAAGEQLTSGKARPGGVGGGLRAQ